MTANQSPDATVGDADLVRYLDGELDERGRDRVERAVRNDASLAARLEQLRTRASRLSTLLDESDAETGAAPVTRRPRGTGPSVIELNAAWAARQGMPARAVPPPRAAPVWLRAAAVVGVLLAGSLLAPPVRAWLAGLLRPVVVDRVDPARGIPVAAAVDTLGITFGSTAVAFTIEFAAAPTAGTLAVDWQDSDSVTAERYSPGGGEELQRIREDLLRVRNSPESKAGYRVVLPARVTRVRVVVPGRGEIVWRPSPGGRRLEFGPRAP